MAIVNRDLDSGEKKEVVRFESGVIAAETTREVWVAPYPCTIQAVKAMVVGPTLAPTVALQTNRFIVGTGVTAITVQAAHDTTVFSTSGLLGMSLPAAGSTLLNLAANDVVEIVTSGSTTTSQMLNLYVALQVTKTQDVLSFF